MSYIWRLAFIHSSTSKASIKHNNTTLFSFWNYYWIESTHSNSNSILPEEDSAKNVWTAAAVEEWMKLDRLSFQLSGLLPVPFDLFCFFQSHLMLIKNAIWPIKCQVRCHQDLLYMKCVYGICGLSFSQEQMLPTPVSWLSLDKLFFFSLLKAFKSYF